MYMLLVHFYVYFVCVTVCHFLFYLASGLAARLIVALPGLSFNFLTWMQDNAILISGLRLLDLLCVFFIRRTLSVRFLSVSQIRIKLFLMLVFLCTDK